MGSRGRNDESIWRDDSDRGCAVDGVMWPKTEQCRGGYVAWFHEAALVTPLSEEG
jgi:hypothetical protein